MAVIASLMEVRSSAIVGSAAVACCSFIELREGEGVHSPKLTSRAHFTVRCLTES